MPQNTATAANNQSGLVQGINEIVGNTEGLGNALQDVQGSIEGLRSEIASQGDDQDLENIENALTGTGNYPQYGENITRETNTTNELELMFDEVKDQPFMQWFDNTGINNSGAVSTLSIEAPAAFGGGVTTIDFADFEQYFD